MSDSLLYKYGNWNNEYHRDRLLKSQLFFAPPGDMNDPFDMRIAPDFSFLNNEDAIENYFQESLQRYTAEQVQNLGGKEGIKKRMFEHFRTQHSQVQSDYETRYISTFDRHFGVLCFSKVWDNILMWSHYSDNHRGFCIGYDGEALIDSCQSAASGPVQYEDYPRFSPGTSDPQKTATHQTFFKAPEWKYEQEYRIVKIRYPDHLPIEERLHAIPTGCIKEIILGVRASAEHKAELLEIGRSGNYSVFQATLVSLDFKLSRERML